MKWLQTRTAGSSSRGKGILRLPLKSTVPQSSPSAEPRGSQSTATRASADLQDGRGAVVFGNYTAITTNKEYCRRSLWRYQSWAPPPHVPIANHPSTKSPPDLAPSHAGLSQTGARNSWEGQSPYLMDKTSSTSGRHGSRGEADREQEALVGALWSHVSHELPAVDGIAPGQLFALLSCSAARDRWCLAWDDIATHGRAGPTGNPGTLAVGTSKKVAMPQSASRRARLAASVHHQRGLRACTSLYCASDRTSARNTGRAPLPVCQPPPFGLDACQPARKAAPARFDLAAPAWLRLHGSGLSAAPDVLCVTGPRVTGRATPLRTKRARRTSLVLLISILAVRLSTRRQRLTRAPRRPGAVPVAPQFAAAACPPIY
ncbi:hypothetical protein B0J12DRAFT_703532 [Macrophomina phaseolina]|uniref:Uncharacterized protein n=1 Tax=Macrophomina phaseolina TaxID=35725 RepID=A0ABQ8FYD4_9PEZI|nr:hypothetical protein B0J12DRAFT_703532 [Macrophomina phaseolina]